MLTKFDYTDSKGKQSARTVYIESTTADSLFCTDLGELNEQDMKDYLDARYEAKRQYDNLVFEINAAYDLKHRYRNFLTKNITNLTKG